MKKYIFIFITLIVFLTNIDFVNALSKAKFRLGEKVPDMRIESVITNDVHNGAMFILRRDDNEFVYCINPFEQLNTTDYYNPYTYNDKIFNITDEQLNKMNLIAYYGYNYGNHTDLKWYGVTQFLIWKTLDLKDIYFTDSNKKKIVAYESEIKEVETLVENHYKLPSFSNNHFKYTIESSYEITDSNGILNYYEIKSSNIDSRISNNKLYINTKDTGNYEITFVRKSPVTKDYILYGLQNNQALLYPGKINNIEFKITIEVNSGSVTVNKFDSEGIIREFATLKGAIYGIYQNDNLIKTIETNEEGIAYIDNIPYGKYYLKEITPSLGYELDLNTYEFEITEQSRDIVINSYEHVIKGNVTLNKLDSEGIDRTFATLKGAVYGIYQNDNLIKTIETNEDGIAYIKDLPYGKYYLKEITPSLGYELDLNTYEFEITEQSRDIVINSYEHVIKGNVTLNKLDSEGIERTFATLKGAIYGIYQNDILIKTIETNEEGIAYIKDLPYGKYYLKEITPSLGYELDEKIYGFEITKETNNIVINSYEHVIKGNIILNKYYGENGEYEIENGAIFEIYDINDNFIGIYKTQNGVIKVELDYGQYYVIQIKGKDDYTYVDKFEILVDSAKEYIFDLYDEKEVLIVEVPDTSKTDYDRLIPISFIMIGLILVRRSQKKTTE